MDFYKQAAEKGHDIAQKFLGAAYFKGIGTDKNHALAEKWFKILAEKDNVNGQTYLGYIYAMGDGVNQNLIESYMWFYIVSKKHPEPARSEMKKIENYMSVCARKSDRFNNSIQMNCMIQLFFVFVFDMRLKKCRF